MKRSTEGTTWTDQDGDQLRVRPSRNDPGNVLVLIKGVHYGNNMGVTLTPQQVEQLLDELRALRDH